MRQVRLHILPFLAAPALVACAHPLAPEVPGCAEGPCVAMKEAQHLSSITVTPLDLIEDSRCPAEAECIWAGRVRLTVRLEQRGQEQIAELSSEQPLRTESGWLYLREVAPRASTRWRELKPEDYRFGFKFIPDLADPPAMPM